MHNETMVRQFRAVALVSVIATLGCATAAEENLTDAGHHDTAAEPADGEDDVDQNGGGGDSWALDEAGEDAEPIDSEPDGSVADTGTAVVDTGTAVVDTGTAVVDTGTAVVDTGSVMDTFVPPVDTGPTCVVVEGFESGALTGWSTAASGAAPTFPSTSAHDGSHGMTGASASAFYYKTTPSMGKAGDRLFAWVRNTGGRAYLGFGASSAGAKSFVIAPNTGDIRFQDNGGWSYGELSSTATTIVASHWYKAEVVFGTGGKVTGNLYDTDGKTLLSTVSYTFPAAPIGGPALRIWKLDIDTVTYCAAP